MEEIEQKYEFKTTQQTEDVNKIKEEAQKRIKSITTRNKILQEILGKKY